MIWRGALFKMATMRLNFPAKACLLDGTRCRYKDIAFPAG
jgi:hypothetical protein